MPLPAFLVAAAKLAVRRPQRPRRPTRPPSCGTGGATSAASLTPSTTPPTPLADFRALPSSSAASSEDDDFFFGLATAPAHVEDRLEDDWLQFATEHSCDDKEAVHDQKPADAVMASAGGDGGSQQASRSTGDEKASDGEQRKPIKVAMEAMLRGFENFAEGGESDGGGNCSHNVPCPQESLKFWSDPDTELKLGKETGISVFRMGVDWTRTMPKEPTEEFKSSLSKSSRIWNESNAYSISSLASTLG